MLSRKLNKGRRVAVIIGADQKNTHWQGNRLQPCICLDEHSTPGDASEIAQGQELGSIPGPFKETGRGGQNGVSEGIVAGDEFREAAGIGEKSGQGARFLQADEQSTSGSSPGSFPISGCFCVF